MKFKNIFALTMGLLLVSPLFARTPSKVPGATNPNPPSNTSIELRAADCLNGTSSYDLSINNVRARLLIAGDMWWDLNNRARYVVPNVALGSGLPEVSSLFAGGIWLGGKDPGGNLKLAAQTFRSATETDFWPGPLDTVGNTSLQICKNWDNHFVVTGEDIQNHKSAFENAEDAGLEYDCSLVPQSVKSWPARGNPYFFEINNFELPNNNQGLALFFDKDMDGSYDPCKGDYPVVDIRGCELTGFPDEMVFWIFNDNGNVHTQSVGSTPIRMEVQVQAFAYATNDQLNDMSFVRYKLINRAIEVLDSTYFAVWNDPDLGCPGDDYFGCDTSRSLAVCYNFDAQDGINGISCTDGIATYGENIPVVAIDYFRGPRDTDKPVFLPGGTVQARDIRNELIFEEIGMSSFTYYTNGGFAGPATSDPTTAQHYYNYMTGLWRDGTPFTFGGTGYDPASTNNTKFAFPSDPTDQTGWSMCAEGLQGTDGRTIQASGPFKLVSGAINELIVGIPWVPDQNYPCPNFEDIAEADDIAQTLFDNCFNITDGPDAPSMTFVELDQEIIIALSNEPSSNNFNLAYSELDLQAPSTQPDTLFKFEGYIIYQLRDASVGVDDYTDPDKSRIVFQADIKNNVKTLFNWKGVKANGITSYTPESMVEGSNTGIINTFQATQDQFSTAQDRTLRNHKKYYYAAIAYAHNEWKEFDPTDGTGQAINFLAGRRNLGDPLTSADYYVVTPRPITDRLLNSTYGTSDVKISRLEGIGTDINFLDVADSTRESFLVGSNGTIPYLGGSAPIRVSIYNPLLVKDAQFELTFVDNNMDDTIVENSSRWELKQVDSSEVIISAQTIESLNEQLLNEFGFSVSIQQGTEPGLNPFLNEANGFVGARTEYRESGNPWFTSFIDGPLILDFLQTGNGELMFGNDPNNVYSQPTNLCVPYQLCSWLVPSNLPMLYSPAWHNSNSNIVRDSVRGLAKLNNVDIVFTRDTTKWSRCIVVETSNPYHYGTGENDLGVPTRGGSKNFDVTNAPSVGRSDADGDGLPDLDGAIENMLPLVGTPQSGMGWFPGYAVDVETGERLNIFFGEATAYNQANFEDFGTDIFGAAPNARGKAHDMMWNPTSDIQLGTEFDELFDLFIGGHQYFYVTDQKYDGCDSLRTRLDPKFGSSQLRKISALRRITWASVPYLQGGQEFRSYKDGLIPNEMVMKLRVQNKYAYKPTASSVNNGYPTYRIDFTGLGTSTLDQAGVNKQLDMINVVPNPYYGYSPYETSQFTTTVKITNLPPVCKITIYSLDGKFIKQFNRREADSNVGIIDAAIPTRQYTPDLEWDLRNNASIPIAGGLYLIHIDAPGLGERVIKWFGTNRQFDPSGL